MEGDFPLLARLNSAQREVVTAGSGHLCINAAAGTGKTSTLAARILYLQLERGVSPKAILAVSFSRAAREALARRLEEFIAQLGAGSNVLTLTLHGLAFRVLRMAAETRETWLKPDFTVLAAVRDRPNAIWEAHAGNLLSNLRDSYSLDTRLQLYPKAVDMLRQGHPGLDEALVSPEEISDDLLHAALDIPVNGGSPPVVLADVKAVWTRYNRMLRNSNAIDYAGMVSECLNALYNGRGETLKRAQHGVQQLIVDEYQDTSKAQEELVRLLAEDRASVTVVGDSDQTIYAFNGSSVENILTFTEKMGASNLPVLPSIFLYENYRSTPNILDAANRVLGYAGADENKRLQPARLLPPGSVDDYRRCNLDVQRVMAPKPELAAAWVAAEINRLMEMEGIAPQEIAVLVRSHDMGGVVREAMAAQGLQAQVQERDPQRTADVLRAVNDLLNDPDNYAEAVDTIIGRVAAGLCDSLLATVTVAETLTVLHEALRNGAAFAYEAAEAIYDKAAPDQTPPDISGVQVRTIHSAKGLEFRVVFLLYVADGLFPVGSRGENIAEERRLYYVGITRAMERLYVLGRPGVMSGVSFFDEINGPGVSLVQAVPALAAQQAAPAVDDDVVRQVEAARRRQKELQGQRRTPKVP